MEKIEKQRLEQLVRLGIVPSNKLPILVQGLENLSMGKQLLPNEREVISKYMDNLTSIMLNDTTVFNRAKLHTQKSKYQAEEITVNNGVKIFDNPEEEEQHRKQTERKLKVRAADKKERFKLLPAAVKREKRKAGLDEDLLAINNTYQAVFEAALELYGVTNIRDLPEEKKAEFFIVVDSASSDNDLSDIEEDMKVKQAVGIASDKRYKKGNMTGAVNAIEKLRPGLSDHPQVKAVLKRQNENVETDIEQLDEKNVPTSPEKWAQAKSQAKAKFDVYPSAYANGWAAKKYKEMGGSWKSMKEEVELDESFKVIATHGKVEVRSHPGDSEGNHISIHKNGKEVASGDYDFYADSYFISHPSLGKGQKPFNSAKSIAHHFSTMKEEIEQVDELKTGTLLRYANKAGKDALSKGIESGRARDMGDDDKAAGLKQKSYKRYTGQKQAIGKINNRFKSGVNVGEEVELDEGRPSQQHPLEGHAYHKKSNAELEYIAKDATEAAEAMKSHNTTAENKYRDQANDSATVRHFRKRNGMPDWYKKKYGHIKEEVESVNELVGNQHKIDANKNGKVDAHDFKLLRSKKKQPQGADFAAQRRKERLASSGRMDENLNDAIAKIKKPDITQQMADKAKKDNITQSDKEKLSKLSAMMKKENVSDSGRMDERYEDDDYGSMSKKEFKRREMEHELRGEDGAKRKSSNSNTKVQGSPLLPGIRPYSGFKKEEVELTFEEMTPAQKAERLRMIARAADRVQSGAAEKSVKKLAKRDMKSSGAQRGMAPLKKDVDEQIQILRKTIVEGTAREKIVAYKELNNLIQEKLKGEE
jgi:hypothetical protein